MSVLPGVRRAFADWMVNHRPHDHVDVPLPTVMSRQRTGASVDPAVECWTVDEVLRALWDDPSPASQKVAVLLGLPAGTSHGRVARLLAQARAEDPRRSWPDVVMQVACRPLRAVAGRHVGAPHATRGSRSSTGATRRRGLEARQ